MIVEFMLVSRADSWFGHKNKAPCSNMSRDMKVGSWNCHRQYNLHLLTNHVVSCTRLSSSHNIVIVILELSRALLFLLFLLLVALERMWDGCFLAKMQHDVHRASSFALDAGRLSRRPHVNRCSSGKGPPI